MLNPAPIPVEWWRFVDVVTPNVLAALADVRHPSRACYRHPADLAALGQRPLDLGVGAVAMTDGAHGAWVFERSQAPLHIPPFQVNAINTVGAGDAFNAGLCVALVEGQSLADAARFASATAALACTLEGAATAMPLCSEVQSLLLTH